MKKNELERRFSPVTLDVEGRILSGTVMTYGDLNPEGPYGPEKFLPGSIEFSDVILNFQHVRSRPLARTPDTLVLSDSETVLEMMAELPETRECTDALELVRKRVIRGLSVEFRVIKQTFRAGVREIERAQLGAIGLVDKPAFENSKVEARGANGNGRPWVWL